jgi:hypothetical protein
MIPEQRLVDEGTEFERDLLASARLDAGPAKGLDRTLAAMAGTSAGAASMAGASAAGTSLGHAAVLVKWIGLATVIVGISASTLARLGAPKHEQRTGMDAIALAASPAVSATGSGGVEVQPSVVAPSGSRPSFVEPPGPRTGLARKPGVGGERAGAAEPPRMASTLDAEVAALEDVRAALSRGDTLSALHQLDAFGHSFPRSVLAEEAVVLRIDALARHGDRVAAADLARRFLSAHPTSAHAPRVRALIADAQIP